MEKVQRKYEMILVPQKEYAIVVKLDGSLKAIEAARKSYSEINS